MGSFTHFARALRKYKIEQRNGNISKEGEGNDDGELNELLPCIFITAPSIRYQRDGDMAKAGLVWSGNDRQKLLYLRSQHLYLSERHFCRKYCKQFQRSANAVKWNSHGSEKINTTLSASNVFTRPLTAVRYLIFYLNDLNTSN